MQSIKLRSVTGRTTAELTVTPGGAVVLTVHRDGPEVLGLTVEKEMNVLDEVKSSTTVHIDKHPGNLIIEG